MPLPPLHLPSVSSVLNKHWKTITKDPKMSNIFPKPHMVVFKQPSNLKKVLCHAKFPAKLTSNRQLTDGCPTCPYIHHSKDVKSSITKETLSLNELSSCLTKVVIYIITFTKHYVGQTGRRLNNKIFNQLSNIH